MRIVILPLSARWFTPHRYPRQGAAGYIGCLGYVLHFTWASRIIREREVYIITMAEAQKQQVPYQPPLFTVTARGELIRPVAEIPDLTSSSSLEIARWWYRRHLEQERRPINTITSYMYDLALLQDFIGPKPVERITPAEEQLAQQQVERCGQYDQCRCHPEPLQQGARDWPWHRVKHTPHLEKPEGLGQGCERQDNHEKNAKRSGATHAGTPKHKRAGWYDAVITLDCSTALFCQVDDPLPGMFKQAHAP